jgi:hypothetical protein
MCSAEIVNSQAAAKRNVITDSNCWRNIGGDLSPLAGGPVAPDILSAIKILWEPCFVSDKKQSV